MFINDHILKLPLLECTYSSMDANGTVIGGLSTREEMCNSNLAYYPAMELDMCRSAVVMSNLLKEFGIDDLEERYTQILYFIFFSSCTVYVKK